MTAKFLFWYHGKPIYEGSEEHKDLEIFEKFKRVQRVSVERSERLKKMHIDGTINAKYFTSKNKPTVSVNVFDHLFTKQNGATLEDDSGCYDLLKCDKCGLTGKRYGVSDMVKCQENKNCN